MGVGVDTRETYENLAESRMNAEHLFGPSVRTEILNYGISGNHLFQSVAVADLKTPDHQPQILIYPAHANESHRALTSIFKAVATGRDLLYPELTELMAQAGIAAGTTEAEFMDRLNPKSSEIVRMGYQKLAEIARSRGEDVIWMYVPTLDDNVLPGEQQELEQMARSMGFHILSLADAYRGKDPQSLTVAPWDTHPNKAGHELLAREWIRQWRLHPELIGLPKAYPSLRDCH